MKDVFTAIYLTIDKQYHYLLLFCTYLWCFLCIKSILVRKHVVLDSIAVRVEMSLHIKRLHTIFEHGSRLRDIQHHARIFELFVFCHSSSMQTHTCRPIATLQPRTLVYGHIAGYTSLIRPGHWFPSLKPYVYRSFHCQLALTSYHLPQLAS